MEWSLIDLSSYFYSYGVHGLIVGLFIGSVLGLIIGWPVLNKHFDGFEVFGGKESCIFFFIFVPVFSFIVMAIALLPTHEKILELKIAKIKNEAVTDENLSKSLDVIERIGRRLECKYLGCESDGE